jgi:cytoskeletal protein RodZ
MRGRRNDLDGPAMGYGPVQAAGRTGVPRSTVVLAVICVLLAAALVFVLLQRTAPPTAGPAVASATPSLSSASASPTASPAASTSTTAGTDATERAGEPAGVRAAAALFLRAWREPSADVRVPLLRVVATDSLTEQLSDVDPHKVVRAKPVGELVVGEASDYAASADQRLSNHTTVRMQLIYDPASRYGWLVDTIAPLR